MAENIIERARDYVLQLLLSKLPNDMSFHNAMHTQDVVKAAIEIATESRFTAMQSEIVTLAVWFHDCGYTTVYTNHEDSSKIIAADFLNRNNYPQEMTVQVLAWIEATRFPQNPKSPEEEVLADADLYHFTKTDYPKYERRLRMEFKACLGKTYTDEEWEETNYVLLKQHSYSTMYGKTVLQKFKEVNMERLKTKLTK